MSVISASTVTPPPASSLTRRRLCQQVVAEAGRNAHSDQEASVPHLAGLGIALVPAEALCAEPQAFDELPLRKAALRLFRIDLCVVKNAELDRIEAELLGHFVHRDLERHHAGRLARGSHRIAFRQVEMGQPHGREAVRARVEQPRLRHRRLWLAVL